MSTAISNVKSHVIRISIALIALVISLAAIYTVSIGRDKDAEKDPHGWAWNAYGLSGGNDAIGLGWISLNCLNDFDNDSLLEFQCDSVKPYGVYVDDGDDGLGGSGADNVKGCGWSGAYGWICFNGGNGSSYQCNATQNSACNDGPQWRTGVAIEEHSSGNFYHLRSPDYVALDQSWTVPDDLPQRLKARILSLYEAADSEKNIIAFPFTDDATRNPLDASYVGSVTMAQSDVAGCFNCDSSTGQCGACLNVSTDAASDTNPNPNILCWGCSSCTILEEGGSCVTNRDRNTCPVASCTACTDTPGVIINSPEADSYEMCGWGWHAYDTGTEEKGLGWVAFNSETTLGDIAYIDVAEGSILSLGNVYAPGAPPQGQYNSAFIIEASGDITNWYSENAYRFENAENLPSFLTQDGSGTYSNVLGSIDFTGLTIDVETGQTIASGDESTNKYGMPIQNWSYLSDKILDIDYYNGVQYFNDDTGTTTINTAASAWYSDTTMLASSSNESATFVVIVDDNLYISSDIFYETAAQYYSRTFQRINSLNQIPSLVWIVRGDVIIDPSVTDVAGTFIVLGDPNVASCPQQNEERNGCGRFITGSSSNQLTIYGTVMARQFSFERSYGTGGQPSERFMPEGRLQANPPTGFTDFVQSVPRLNSDS